MFYLPLCQVIWFTHVQVQSFLLLQSEDGDLFKVTIDCVNEEVVALNIKYFDTVPVATSLCIVNKFLFVASEFGNPSVHISLQLSPLTDTMIRHLYVFQGLGEDDPLEVKSTSYPSFGMENPSNPLPRVYFTPRPLENLRLVDELASLNPIIDSKVLNLLPNSDTPQIYTACGRGARSTLRTLRHGLEVDEFEVAPVTSAPNGVWWTKIKETGEGTVCDSQPLHRSYSTR